MMRKLISLILSLVMVFTIIPATTLNVSALSSSGSCGDNVTYTFDSSTCKLIISGTGDMWYNYNTISSPFHDSSIKSVEIESGVTSISYGAFYGCKSLTSVTIGDSVTSIGERAFYGCTSLTSITIGDSVTSIGGEAFYNCPIKELIIADGCKKIKSAMVVCKSTLEKVLIPNSVTSIGSSAFSGCTSLTSITIPNSVTSIGSHAFSGCTSLTSITIGDSVTSIGDYAFSNCTSLESINVSENNSNYVSDNGVLFNKEKTQLICYPAAKTAKSYSIPNSVTSIGSSAFSGCTSLTSITIGDSVTSIGNYAFDGCTSLTSITIGDSVTSIGISAFYGCTSLNRVNITSVLSWLKIDFNNENSLNLSSNPLCYAKNLYVNNSLLTNLEIPNDITKIGNDAFYCCTSLTIVLIPKGVTSIGKRAFASTSSLTDLYYGGTKGEFVKAYPTVTDDLKLVNIHLNATDCDILGHKTELRNAKAATCSKKGYTGDMICTVCGETVEKGEEIEKLPHTEGETVMENIVDSTCTERGSYYEVVYCSVCGEQISKIKVIVPANSHKTELRNVKTATCSDKGYTGDMICTVCGETIEQGKEIAKLSHTKAEAVMENIVDPTCTKDGSCDSVVYCSVCGEELSRENIVVKADGHKTELRNVKAVTCTEDGYTGDKVCTVCGEIIEKGEFIQAQGHKRILVNAKSPTCTEKGYTGDYYCIVCNQTIEQGEEIAKLPHTEGEAVMENIVDSTCTERGSYYEVVYCSICGEQISKIKIIVPEISHKLVSKNAKVATYFEKGYTGDKVCSVCGEVIEKGKAIAKLKLATPKFSVTAGKKLFKVKYNKVKGATGFQLRYKISGKWTTKNFDTKKTVTKTIKKLTTGKKYTVQIRAFVKSGKKTAYSDWSKTQKVKIK